MSRDRPSASVVPFPTRFRTGKIARTAETILNSTEKATAYHWRRTIADMRRQMERAGLAEAVIESEVRVFADAVGAEVARRSHGAVRR